MDSKSEEIPQLNFKKQCPNCDYSPLLQETKYCPSCGQECKDKRVTVWNLVMETFANIFNLDNKLWQTLLNLFIPGKLTKEFFIGRRQRYVPPLRIFLITALGFFAIIQMFLIAGADKFVIEVAGNQKEKTFYGAFLDKLTEESDSILLVLGDSPVAEQALDSLNKRMHLSYSDSITIGVVNLFSRTDSIAELTIAQKDLAQMNQDSLVQHYGNGHFWDDLILRQNIRLTQKGENFLAFLMSQLIWMMLIMMPFLALFLKLIYIRRGFYYVDHLIFSLHIQTFVFVLFSVLLLLNNYLSGTSILDRINSLGTDLSLLGKINSFGSIAGGVYLFMALLKVYGQSKRKTFVKFILINFFYGTLLIIASVVTSIIAMLFF